MINKIHHYPDKEGHYIVKRLSTGANPVEYYTDDYFTFETKWIFDPYFGGNNIIEIIEDVSGLDDKLIEQKIEKLRNN